MAAEIEALIKRRSRELAALMNGGPLSSSKASLRRERARRLQGDLLELLAIRRRVRELARLRGHPGAVRHAV